MYSYLLEHVEENRATLNMWSDWNWCWFQTSLPLAALPLHRMIIACCFRVKALSGHAALALSPSGIAIELNRIQLSVVCCCGQTAGLSIYWQDAAYRLVFPLRVSGKWCLRSCTKITIKAMRRAASWSESSISKLHYDDIQSKIIIIRIFLFLTRYKHVWLLLANAFMLFINGQKELVLLQLRKLLFVQTWITLQGPNLCSCKNWLNKIILLHKFQK